MNKNYLKFLKTAQINPVLALTTAILLMLDAALASDMLVFTPNIIDMKFDGTPATVQVSLAQPAASAVNVQFESDDLFRLDCCSLEFGPGKPSAYNVTVFPAGLLAKTLTTALKAKVITGSGSEEQAVTVRRQVMLPTAMCQSNGENNYHTFDQTPYSFKGQADGWYCVADHPSFSIQTQLKKGSDGSRTNGNIAVRHWDGLLLFDISTKGETSTPYSLRKFGNQKVFSYITCEKTFVEIGLCDGGSIRIDYRYGVRWYADIATKVPDFLCEKTKGLCGNFDGKKDTIQDGSFLMPANMTYYSNQKTPDLVAPSKPILQCKFSNTPKETMFDLKFTHCPKEQCVTKRNWNQQCTNYCKALFQRFNCTTQMVDVNQYCQDCINDCNTSNDRSAEASYASSAVAAFQEAAAFMAQVCWKANDIKGTIELQKCARVEVKSIAATCLIEKNTIVGTELQFPAMSGTCQKGDGSPQCPA